MITLTLKPSVTDKNVEHHPDPGCCRILELRWAISRQELGRLVFEDLLVTKPIDGLSPGFAVACASNQDFSEAVIEFWHPASSLQDSPAPFYRIRLDWVHIVGISMKASAQLEKQATHTGFLQETVALHFFKVSWEYCHLDAQGKPTQQFSTRFSRIPATGL